MHVMIDYFVVGYSTSPVLHAQTSRLEFKKVMMIVFVPWHTCKRVCVRMRVCVLIRMISVYSYKLT